MDLEIDPEMKDAVKEIQRKRHEFREKHEMKKSRTAYPKKSMEEFR